MKNRLLPWSGEGGKSCYLAPDDSGSGVLSCLADGLESIQLDMAVDLLDRVDDALPGMSANELRGFGAALRQSLRDAARVARSRQERLELPEAPELEKARALLTTADALEPHEPSTVQMGVALALREAVSDVVDLAERYGEELPGSEAEGAALRVVEVLGREIAGGPALLLGRRRALPAAGDQPSTAPDHAVREGGAS